MEFPEVSASNLLPPERQTWGPEGSKVGRHTRGSDLVLTSATNYSGKQSRV